MGNLFSQKHNSPVEAVTHAKAGQQHTTNMGLVRELPSKRADGSTNTVPPELISFIQTAPGAAWLAEILLDWPGHVNKLRAATISDVSLFVIERYKQFVASDLGRRLVLTPAQRKAAQEDLLVLPVYLIEDVVRQRLRAKITGNWWSTGWFMATRTPPLCAAVAFAKYLLMRHVVERLARSRHKRAAQVATFIISEMLPTGFYGPLLACGILAQRVARQLEDS